MTDRDVVEHVANLFERAVVRLRRRKPHHKVPYATTIKGAPAVQVMSAVRPFLGKARELQIDLAISSWQTRTAPRRRSRAHRSDSQLPLVADPWCMLRPDGEAREACDRAWIAGLLEGEGSFIASRGARSSYPVIKVEMCEQEVIEHAARVLDTRVWFVPPGTEGWRPTYVAQVAGHRAAEWMRVLRPNMGLRRTAAIDAALSAYHPIRLIAPPLVCVIEGCDRPHRARGLCNTHYCRSSRPQDRQVRGLHELVPRSRARANAEDHATPLIRSRSSRQPTHAPTRSNRGLVPRSASFHLQAS